MKSKRIIASFLLTTFLSLFATPLTNEVSASSEQESLYEFLQNTDKISASYKYPSMKLASTSPGSGKLLIPAHTPIAIRCEETITTRNVVSGGTVNFSVVGDIKDSNGNILIKSGSPVTAEISFARDRGMIGRSGELTVNDFHTTAVDGTYIPLSGSVSAKPDDKMTLSVVLSVLICPLFLLMHGDDARLPVGSTKTAYTITDTYVKTNRL